MKIVAISFFLFLIQLILYSCSKININSGKELELPNNTIEFTQELHNLGDLNTEISSEFNTYGFDTSQWEITDRNGWTPIPDGYTKPFFAFDIHNVNLNLKNGTLDLQVLQEDTIYTTAWIISKEKFTQGYFEARLKITTGYSFHPAFWLAGGYWKDNNYDEIDIFETINALQDKRQRFITDIHTSQNNDKVDYTQKFPLFGLNSNKYSDTFHTFGLLLTDETIIWFWNNQEIRREPNNISGSPMRVMFTAGLNGGSIPDDKHPASMPYLLEIDYLRVFSIN